MRVAIVGAGLAGLAAAVDLVDAGHTVDLYEARPFIGGKVGSWEDPDGNHVEMGLHVFFFNYANLFALMQKVGAINNLLPKAWRRSSVFMSVVYSTRQSKRQNGTKHPNVGS